MSNQIDISIVIVNYNVKDLLFHCLRSIEKSTASLNVETIVVDNDSQDGSIDYLEPKFPDVKFIRLPENIGFGRANNIGFKHSNGKYILILNPDSFLSESTLQVMFDYMEINPQVGMSGCKVLNADGSFQLACRRGFPTPWSSFCKLFGLQSLFPKSQIFAQYNQTFRSIDETYYIDAIIGAFMFARRDVIEEIGGFDEDFFMYGEDIDICKRIYAIGKKIAYVHTTTIIHYKGESTRRSSINEIKHFYDAMQIYAKKHFSSSSLFLLFLRVGILIRQFIAYFTKYSRDLLFIAGDLVLVNLALLLATYLRFGEALSFPDYAYPTINIVISAVVFVTMLLTGEYFEGKQIVRRAFSAYMISFFFLSSLTYFFNNYAFSRGVLLLMIGLSISFSAILRFIVQLFDRAIGKDAVKKVLIVGFTEKTDSLIERLQSVKSSNIEVVGIVLDEKPESEFEYRIPILGSIDILNQVVKNYGINEVIITDENISKSQLFNTLHHSTGHSVRFNAIYEDEDLIVSQTINELTGDKYRLPKYNLSLLRYRLMKYAFESIVSIILLTFALPITFMMVSKSKIKIKDLFEVIFAKKQFVGILDRKKVKQPITGPAQIIGSEKLTQNSINELNGYYLSNYSLSLDFDLILKFIFR